MQVGAGAQSGHFVDQSLFQHEVETAFYAVVQDAAIRGRHGQLDQAEGWRLGRGLLGMPLRQGFAGEFVHFQGTLQALCRGQAAGRQGADEITLFKSVGTALEDLAAAERVIAGP